MLSPREPIGPDLRARACISQGRSSSFCSFSAITLLLSDIPQSLSGLSVNKMRCSAIGPFHLRRFPSDWKGPGDGGGRWADRGAPGGILRRKMQTEAPRFFFFFRGG